MLCRKFADSPKSPAAVRIDRRIGGTQAQMPAVEKVSPEDEKTAHTANFEPKKRNMRKRGTGCVTKLSENCYEGKYSPNNAYGKRISRNIYAPTEEECETKLAELIKDMNREIAEEKARLRANSTI